MGRYTGPKCRLCRREGMKLFLKGIRCESEKCAIARRDYPPGNVSFRILNLNNADITGWTVSANAP